jgi:predicted XRE-type DNA-binding protein
VGECRYGKVRFSRLDLQNADDLVKKSRLMQLVTAEIRKRGVTQSAAGEILDFDQPNVSALMNEKISRFSVEKLMEFAGKLGFAVTIHVEGNGVALDVPEQSAA